MCICVANEAYRTTVINQGFFDFERYYYIIAILLSSLVWRCAFLSTKYTAVLQYRFRTNYRIQ